MLLVCFFCSIPLLEKRLGNGRGVRDTLALHFGQWSPKEISLCTFDLIIITSKFSFHVHFLHQIGLLLFYVMIFQKDVFFFKFLLTDIFCYVEVLYLYPPYFSFILLFQNNPILHFFPFHLIPCNLKYSVV